MCSYQYATLVLLGACIVFMCYPAAAPSQSQRNASLPTQTPTGPAVTVAGGTLLPVNPSELAALQQGTRHQVLVASTQGEASPYSVKSPLVLLCA